MADKQPAIVERDAFTVIGLATSCAMSDSETLAALWHGYEARASEIAPRTSDTTAFGVFFSSPEQAGKGEMSYMACAPVHESASVPEGMVKKRIPGGTFARYTHRGYLTQLRNSYQTLYGWIGEAGCETDLRPGYEYYDERFDPASPDCEIDLYVPVIAGSDDPDIPAGI